MLLTIFAWTMLAALLAMLLAPDARIGRAVRETLIDAPARFLLDLTWAKAGRVALLAPVFVVLVLAGPEMLAMLIMMGGDLAAVELLLAVWATSVSGGVSVMWRRFVSGAARLLQFARKAIKKPRKDGDEPGWAYA
jgi:hypothetical protein